MSTITQPPRPPIPSRPREPIGNRPLPRGIVGLAQPQAQPPAQVRTQPGQAVPDSAPEGTLIVGRDIQVKGQIDDCRALVVEGRVEATLKTDRLEVRKGGIFVGSAEVERADIAGTFEGSLNVTGQLGVADGGRVRGETRYARIIVEAGGAIVGTAVLAEEADDRRERPSLADTGS